MTGVTLATDSNKKLIATLDTEAVGKSFTHSVLRQAIAQSEYANLWIFEDRLMDIAAEVNVAIKNDKHLVLERECGERRDATIRFSISDDRMSATLEMKAPFGGEIPNIDVLIEKAKSEGIKRGISTKRLQQMIDELANKAPGDVVKCEIAKGLPARNGKNSRLKPLVPNALERVLKPQSDGKHKVNMRDLGEMICVKPGTALVQRIPPTKGRAGYNVQGSVIAPDPGKLEDLRVSEGTRLSPTNPDILEAIIAGMPKFKGEKMWVDDTFSCKGVNVATGNIKYNGSVIVNGDVTERMEIVAEGDITINGFVQSAYLQAGGDVVITQGAAGKHNEETGEYSCQIVAQGSVFVQHGQGLDITCNDNVTVMKQLSHSRIHCSGNVTIGAPDRPYGSIFACDISCAGKLRAGAIGAVSGSSLSVDFSESFNHLLEQQEGLEGILKRLERTHRRHMSKIERLQKRDCPMELRSRLDEAKAMCHDEQEMIAMLYDKIQALRENRLTYEANIGIEAFKKLYPGVSVKLNKRVWKADKEYDVALVAYDEYRWKQDVLSN